MKRWFFCASILFVTSTVFAQSPNANLDQRAGQVIAPGELSLIGQSALRPSDGPTGGDDLILLDEVPIFVLRAGASAGYTSNAFLSGDNDRSDCLLSLQVQAGVETVVNESFDLRLLANVGSVRYREFQELDFDQLGATLEAARAFDFARVGLRYQPTSFHDSTFDDQVLMLHPFTLFAQKQMPFKGWQADFELGLQRTWGDPSDYNSTALYLESRLARQLARQWFLSAGLELRYQHYDDFFESQTNTQRQDFLIRPSVQVIFQPKPWLVAWFELSAARNFSELDATDYSVISLTPSVQVQFRF